MKYFEKGGGKLCQVYIQVNITTFNHQLCAILTSFTRTHLISYLFCSLFEFEKLRRFTAGKLLPQELLRW